MKYQSSLTFDRNFVRQLAFFSTLTIVIGVLGYFVIMGLFRVFNANIPQNENWNLLEGFVGVVSLCILVGGLAYPVVDRIRADVTEAREKTRISYEIYQAIFEKLTDPAQEAARRWILLNIPLIKPGEDPGAWYEQVNAKIMEGGKEAEGLLPEGQQYVKMTLNCLDYIGFIAKNYWVIEADSLDWLSPPIAKIWRRIGPYVLQVRRLRHTTDYYVFAQYIGEKCIERRQERGLGDEEIAKNTP